MMKFLIVVVALLALSQAAETQKTSCATRYDEALLSCNKFHPQDVSECLKFALKNQDQHCYHKQCEVEKKCDDHLEYICDYEELMSCKDEYFSASLNCMKQLSKDIYKCIRFQMSQSKNICYTCVCEHQKLCQEDQGF